MQPLEEYLLEALDIQAKAISWKGEKKLPFYLQDTYSFYECSFPKKKSLLFISKKNTELTPAKIHSDLKQLRQKYGDSCIYVTSAISSYDRKRLIGYKVPFIVPGNQMFLPEMGVDLREHFRKKETERMNLSPSAQALLIHVLLHKEKDIFSSSELVKTLKYSRMSIVRALDEVRALALGKELLIGNERALQVPKNRREFWEIAKTHLRSPVKKRYLIKKYRKSDLLKDLGNLSGLSALSKHSMLQSPKIPSYAIDKKTWPQLSEFEKVFTDLEADFEIEVWKYDPKLFAKKGIVDPYSLYLSLRGTADERVEAALEEIKW